MVFWVEREKNRQWNTELLVSTSARAQPRRLTTGYLPGLLQQMSCCWRLISLQALWIIMCTAGCRHLEDFICLVLVRKILWDANEGASHGTLSKTGLFFNSWSAYITTHFIALHLLMWHKNRWCWYINIQHFLFIQNFWLIHVLLALFVIGYNQNAQLWINNNIAQEHRIRSIFTYQISPEYSFLTGQFHHPAVRCFLIFLVRFLNNIILFINQLIR